MQIENKNIVLPTGSSLLFFVSPGWWIGNEQLFKVTLMFSFATSMNHK